MAKERKPLSFGSTMLAGALGVVIVWAIGGVLSLVMMVSMIMSISKMDSNETALVRSNTALSLNLGRISGDRTPSSLEMTLGGDKSIGLIDACTALRNAATDDKISALYITDPGSTSLSWASLSELRAAVEEFRASGKPVVSYSTSYSQPGYYLCSAAEQVYLHPSGMVDFRGMGAEVMYYKELLQKVGVEMQLIRPESCAYKSAGEVYTLDHMSEANREQIRAYIGSIWHTATEQIALSRADRGGDAPLTAARLNEIADRLSGYLATDALEQHLVDSLSFEADVKKTLRDAYGAKHLMNIQKYAAGVKKGDASPKESIALIYAEGNVVDGSAKGFANAVYGDDIVKALRQASEDDNVKAIVLRVNSPGGQATASESMTYAVRCAREKKPVIVSMGDLAASAGYEMSCLADVIVAEPMTITGSIGVFGTLPSFERTMKQKLGVNADTVQTNRNSTGLSIFRPLSHTAKAMMERNVEDFYRVFVGRVAEGRRMDFDAVHSIARGRVWTGVDAKKIGLVDTLGGLDLAFRIAAEKAELEKYSVREFPKEKDTWTLLNEMLGEEEGDALSLRSKLRLALQYRLHRKDLEAVEAVGQDLLFLSQSEGVQARLPFVLIYE